MWWFVVLFAGCIAAFMFLEIIFELGFRNQGNMDWLIYTEWCNEYFLKKGFDEKGYDGECSSHPATLFERGGCNVAVRLNAPLLLPPTLYSVDIFVNSERIAHFPTFVNRDVVYHFLDDYFEMGIEGKMNISPFFRNCKSARTSIGT